MTTQPLSALTMLLPRHTRRREFITLLGGAAAAWPLMARGQQQRQAIIGLLHTASAAANEHLVAALRRGLSEVGYTEGEGIAIETHWAEGQYERLPAMAADLVRRNAAVIMTGGSTAPIHAAKRATSTTPIVFVSGDDPIKDGLVASLSRPGGNITGIVFFNSVLAAKRVELLRELLPGEISMAYMTNPGRPDAEIERHSVEEASRVYGLRLHVLFASNEREIEASFMSLGQLQVSGLLMAADPFLGSRREQVATLAARHALPVIGTTRDYVTSGCLASYGTNISNAYYEAGIYTGRILKGEKPRDLPVVQPTKFELAINLKTAKALGLEIPPTLLARADEVIE